MKANETVFRRTRKCNGCEKRTAPKRVRYVYGSGSYGCLYDDGPHFTDSVRAAVEALASTFELSRAKKRELARDWYLDLGPKYGADYCEINIAEDDAEEDNE